VLELELELSELIVNGFPLVLDCSMPLIAELDVSDSVSSVLEVCVSWSEAISKLLPGKLCEPATSPTCTENCLSHARQVPVTAPEATSLNPPFPYPGVTLTVSS